MLTASQITHLANSMRYMQQSSIKNRASSIKNPSVLRFASCVWSLRFLSNILYKSPHFYAKQTQFPKLPKSSQAQSPQRITKMKTLQQAPKTNPNEPKRTQSKPNFSPVRAAQTQSKPKQTQNKANRARSLRMTCSKSSNRMTNRRWVNIGVWFPGRATMPKKGDCEGTALLIDSPALLRMNKKFCAVTYRTQQPAERTVKITARGHYAEHFSA